MSANAAMKKKKEKGREACVVDSSPRPVFMEGGKKKRRGEPSPDPSFSAAPTHLEGKEEIKGRGNHLYSYVGIIERKRAVEDLQSFGIESPERGGRTRSPYSLASANSPEKGKKRKRKKNASNAL